MEREKSNNFDRMLSVIALIAGAVALLFSWQANQIAREANEITEKQATSQVIVLSVENISPPSQIRIFPLGYDYEKFPKILCLQYIRLANLGGAPTSIVGYDVDIYVDNKNYKFSSDYFTTKVIR